VRALPRSAWAAAGMLLIASAACTVADPQSTRAPDPSSIGAPAPSSGFPPTVVAAEPTETSALETPAPTAPTAQCGDPLTRSQGRQCRDPTTSWW